MSRILIVDDEPIVGSRLKRLLEKDGHDVHVHADAAAAVMELEKSRFDIVITDLKMDRIDGFKILSIARETARDVKVIIITGYGRKETAQKLFQEGAFDFLIKPFKVNDLRDIIRRAEGK